MRVLYISVVVVVVAVLGFLLLNTYIYTQKQAGGAEAQPAELAAYFAETLHARATENGLIPIEGYDAGLLMGAFPGFVAEDFNGVAATQGTYTVQHGEVSFTMDDVPAVSSAARTVSDAGYITLLEHVSARLRSPVYSKADVDTLITQLRAGAKETVRGSLGKTVTVGSVTITPQSVVEDSRCPTGVQCVWEGRVRLSVQIEDGSGSQTVELTLGEAQTVGAVSLTLTDVSPYPEEGTEIQDADYLFTFDVKQ